MSKILKVNRPGDYCSYVGAETRHPLVAVIDFNAISPIPSSLNDYTHTDGFGSNNSMNSFNHYSFGSAGDWLLSTCLGINHNDNGIVISPEPVSTGHLTYAAGSMATQWGNVSSKWEIIDNGNVKYEIEVPKPSTFIAPSGEEIAMRKGYNSIIL